MGNHNRSYFLFRCDCGIEKIISGSGVVSGNTKSCGCLSTEIRKKKRLPDNYSEVTAIILDYKRHAKARGFSFLLSRDFVLKIVLKNCFYCGIPPSNLKKTKHSIDGLPFNGIDRVDSKLDYIESNVVPCCKKCNNAKSNYNKDVFIEWIAKVYNHSIK
jgi:5-methylcytosine-specific restriction endonuclease McrA